MQFNGGLLSLPGQNSRNTRMSTLTNGISTDMLSYILVHTYIAVVIHWKPHHF